jgi:hypothetical protein
MIVLNVPTLQPRCRCGVSHRWLGSSTGHWVGVCTIIFEYSDGTTYKAVDQLVPAEAIREREPRRKR